LTDPLTIDVVVMSVIALLLELSARGEERLALTAELHRALREGQLRVYYQPQVDLGGPTLCGCEALVRWEHPTRGLVSPGAFIPLAEESGLILPLGEWLLGEACEQAMRWSQQGVDLRMAVNLSPRQFQQHDLPAMVVRALARSGLPADRLELELTETAIIADPRTAAATLREISGLGVSLALDDFGTGYSSLSLLRELPIDRLKFDRSFVEGLEDDPDSAAIARAVIELGRSLDVRVVAEGVETAAQLAFLRAQGCDEGYFFGRPVPADVFELRPSFEVAVDRAAADVLSGANHYAGVNNPA
jgi:diguanylate cyclase